MNRAVLVPGVVAVALITYRGARSLTGGFSANPVPHLPLPSSYVAAALVFGGLSLVPGEGAAIATMVGWGLDVAIFLNLWDPSQKVAGSTSLPSGHSLAPSTTKGTTP